MDENLEIDELQRLQITPLSGAYSEKPLCYMLEIDDLRILLDCGWNEDFNVADFEPLKKVAKTIDICLITFSDMQHIGGLPYAISELGLKCPVLISRACAELSVLNLYDLFVGYETTQGFNHYDLASIDKMRSYFVTLSFGQNLNLYEVLGRDKKGEIMLSIERAGRMIGGSSYRIIRGDEVLMYAVNYNHRSEVHLNAIDFKITPKPTVLLTDAFCYSIHQQRRQNSSEMFINTVLQRLRNGSNVLVPISLNRAAELLLLVENEWTKRGLVFDVSFVSSVSKSYLRFLKSNLEFMHSSLNEFFVNSGKNAFEFQNIRFLTELKELDHFHSRPKSNFNTSNHGFYQPQMEGKLIFCTDVSVERGLTKKLFIKICKEKRSLIIFPERPFNENSLSRKLGDLVDFKKNVILPQVKLRLHLWLYNTPDELKKWREVQKERVVFEERKELQEKQQRLLTEDFLSDSHSQSLSSSSKKKKKTTSLMKVLYEKTKALRTVTFSANEPERFSKFTEYGEVINENDFKGAKHSLNQSTSTTSTTTNIPQRRKGFKTKITLPESVKSEEDFLEYSFGNLMLDACLKREFRERLPRKQIIEDISLFINCDIKFIDFSGFTDSRSVKYILEDLQPLRLVLLSGKQKDIELLRTDIEENMNKLSKIVVPTTLSTSYNIQSKMKSWQITLDTRILNKDDNLLFKEKAVIDDLQIIKIDGLIINQNDALLDEEKESETAAGVEGEVSKDVVEDSTKQNEENMILKPVIVPIPFDYYKNEPDKIKMNIAADNDENKVGELSFWEEMKRRKRKRRGIQATNQRYLLSKGTKTIVDVQKILEKNGIKARFWEGALQCSDDIRIRKDTSSKEHVFEMNSYFSETYLQARKAIQQPFVTL